MHGLSQQFAESVAAFLVPYYLVLAVMNGVAAYHLWQKTEPVTYFRLGPLRFTNALLWCVVAVLYVWGGEVLRDFALVGTSCEPVPRSQDQHPAPRARLARMQRRCETGRSGKAPGSAAGSGRAAAGEVHGVVFGIAADDKLLDPGFGTIVDPETVRTMSAKAGMIEKREIMEAQLAGIRAYGVLAELVRYASCSLGVS